MIKVLKFEAEWCAPCKALDRELENCKSEMKLVRVDADQDQGAVSIHHVNSVPTLIFLGRADQELGRLVGRQTARSIDRMIADLPSA